jgi:Bacterial signalling protein N terminal repeat
MTLPESALVGSYDYRLVAVSVLIAVLASYAALDLAARVTSPCVWESRMPLAGPTDLFSWKSCDRFPYSSWTTTLPIGNF